MESRKKTEILLALSESSSEGYPNPSINSRNVFDWIVEKIVGTNVTGFKLSLLHVHPPDRHATSGSWKLNGRGYNRHQWYQNHTKGAQLLQYFVNKCTEIGVVYQVLNREGENPKKVICREVKRMKPDFLVVGGRYSRRLSGLGSFLRLFMGDVSEYCLKHAKCSVVSVKYRQMILMKNLKPLTTTDQPE